ncbi:lipopolysaccharide assembly protein LapB [Treponema sp. Marseille-Q4130]|uniref:tetratricopeptide repeat protein n=1 Tax=Treponema sp. Marseille-Q4130 TaxID=2766702 RepID=UPI001651DAE8|nr:tetratricopeptide repeat protein [Treponema sp. Marseille-Q4130]MBC6720110.1 tetratricopeptide repeat protein [Treponema sp. Marseille-Q4130]
MASERGEENKLVLRRAAAALASRDFDLAVRLYKGLLKDDPENRDVLFALGDVYVKSGEDKNALVYYEKINKIDPNDAASLNVTGGIYRRLGRYEDALRVLHASLSLGGKKADVNYNLGFTYRSMGDYDKAIECFESVIASDPGDTLAYNHLGVIYALRKEYQKAATAYKRGLQVDPNHPVLQLNLAETYEALHSDGEAETAYEAALRAKPGWMEAVRKYTALLLRRRKTTAAASVVQKAIALHPSDAHLFALLGRVEFKRFDYEAALRAFKKSLMLDPKNTSVISCLADAYEKKGALERGAALMRQAEKDFPSDAAVGAQYVRTLLSARDYVPALAKLKALYAKNQNDIEILDLYAQYCICRGEDEKAASCYKKVNSIDAQYFAYEKSAALRFMQAGRSDKARNFIARYLSKYPHDEEALVLSAQLDTSEKKFSSALDTYRAVLALNDGNVLAKREVKRIAELLVEAEGAKADLTADGNDETAGAEIVMDSPETKALEAGVYEVPPSQEEPFDFDLMGESLLKADDEIDPFTIEDREDEEEDPEADGLDLLVPFDRPIDREENARSLKDDDLLDGRTGPAAGIDESLPGNIDDGFSTGAVDVGFETPVVLPRSSPKRMNYEGEPISITEDAPAARRFSDALSPLSESLSKVPSSLPKAAEKEVREEPAIASRERAMSGEPSRAEDAGGGARVLPESFSRGYDADAVNAERANELAALRRSCDEAHRTSKAARDAAEDAMRIIGTVKQSAERIRTDAALAETSVKDAVDAAMKKIREAAERAISEVDGKSGELIEHAAQKKYLLRENAIVRNKPTVRKEASGSGNVSERADDERGGIQVPQKESVPVFGGIGRNNARAAAELTAALEKAARALPDIAAALQNKKSADQFAIELKLFKKLRSMCDFLPSLQKEKFMASRTRLLLDYVIARLSGKPGLLATAEVLRKIKLPAGLLETNGTSPFTSLTDEQLVPLVIHDMRTKLTDLPDASLAAALDAAASEALENARGR